MKLSQALGLPLDCGGHGRCGRCKVFARGALSPLTATERALLTQEEVQGGIRLACQCEIAGPYTAAPLPVDADMFIQTEYSSAPLLQPFPGDQGIGVVIDIGTTTLAAYWYDLTAGSLLHQKAIANPQRIWGADIMSRLEHATKGQLLQLSACLRQAILSLLPAQYTRIVLTGNTAMLYFLCGYDPAALSHAPFAMDRRFGFMQDHTILPPCFSAFVGADIATAALTAGFFSSQTPALLLDLGTNGEMLLSANERLYGCSTAAGPAFEGSEISCGLPSVPGAICRVDSDFSYETIEGRPAKGYCGSGLLDVIAQLRRCEALDETGLLHSWPAPQLPPLTQADIRQFQLAKAAIAAGCETLLTAAGATVPDTLYLAGGFGSQLSYEHARLLGLVPAFSHVVSLGNGAAAGAAMLLFNPALLNDLLAMQERFTLISLGGKAQFAEAFMRHMHLGGAEAFGLK